MMPRSQAGEGYVWGKTVLPEQPQWAVTWLLWRTGDAFSPHFLLSQSVAAFFNPGTNDVWGQVGLVGAILCIAGG